MLLHFMRAAASALDLFRLPIVRRYVKLVRMFAALAQAGPQGGFV